MEEMIQFWNTIYSVTLNTRLDDKLCWGLNNDKLYTVKSYYQHLMLPARQRVYNFPRMIIWKSKAPPRVQFFCWEVCWGRILTLDNLASRGFPLPNRCILCKSKAKTIDHLLLHCSWSYMIWSNFYLYLGLSWVPNLCI